MPELDLEAVPDPRAREGRWTPPQILRATLVGLMAGCQSLWETEDLTDRLSTPMRRLLRLRDTKAGIAATPTITRSYGGEVAR